MGNDFTRYSINSDTLGIVRNSSQRLALKGEIVSLASEHAPVTLRQIFYLLVNSGWLYKVEREYKNLGVLVTKMRRKGYMPWELIIDSGRYNRCIGQWLDPSHALNSLIRQYRKDVWEFQDELVFIGVEKEALAGVMQPVCDEYGVPLIVSRGYPSATYLHDIYEEFSATGKLVHFFYYGDHDPSGDGISDLFYSGSLTDDSVEGLPCEFNRSALTAAQITLHQYLTRPPKASDSRTKNWNSGGVEAADVDAIPPNILRTMIRDDIESVLDMDVFNETIRQQDLDIEKLTRLSRNWDEIDGGS